MSTFKTTMRSKVSSPSVAEALTLSTAVPTGMTWLRPLRRGNLLATMVVGLAGLAWAALWTWGQSPYARYIDHSTFAADICESAPLSVTAHLAFYVAGWTLMVVAMMLPTTLPLMQMFRRLVAGRRDRTWLLLLLAAGYLSTWFAYGFAAHALDQGIHHALGQLHHMPYKFSQALGAVPFFMAGAFQFSSLKYRCLDRCRSPLGFVTEHWRGGNGRQQAFRLGLAHGAFCVGCCWALMLLMFAVGMGNLAWMLALAAVMTAEKNLSWGRVLAKPLGAALLLIGVFIVLPIIAE